MEAYENDLNFSELVGKIEPICSRGNRDGGQSRSPRETGGLHGGFSSLKKGGQ